MHGKLRDGADDLVGAGDLNLCEVLESGTRQVSSLLKLVPPLPVAASLPLVSSNLLALRPAWLGNQGSWRGDTRGTNRWIWRFAVHMQVVEVPLAKGGRELGQLELCIQVRWPSTWCGHHHVCWCLSFQHAVRV